MKRVPRSLVDSTSIDGDLQRRGGGGATLPTSERVAGGVSDEGRRRPSLRVFPPLSGRAGAPARSELSSSASAACDSPGWTVAAPGADDLCSSITDKLSLMEAPARGEKVRMSAANHITPERSEIATRRRDKPSGCLDILFFWHGTRTAAKDGTPSRLGERSGGEVAFFSEREHHPMQKAPLRGARERDLRACSGSTRCRGTRSRRAG
jgi:hypothetical protein